MRRVLAPGGRAVHVVPGFPWRVWTTLLHPLHLVRLARRRAAGERREVPDAGRAVGGSGTAARPGRLRRALRALVPPRHGEEGNVLTEHLRFRAARWRGTFEAGGWRVDALDPGRLFYSGHGLLGRHLGLRARRRASYVLGSACLIAVLRPAERAPQPCAS
jgi:hypothetical protein